MPQSTYQTTKDKYRKMMMDEELHKNTILELMRMFRSRHGIDADYAAFSPQADGVDVRLYTRANEADAEAHIAIHDWMAKMA